MKIHKDDRVMVMAGKDITATGRVLRVDPGRNKVLVEGVNRVKRHEKIRPTQRGGQTGGITEKEAWLDASNVQIVCPSCGKPTRVSHRVEEGNKLRVCAKCDAKL
ncbi:MAG TPA: 50S ribosomal protein L24 [Actinomycetes bacterium]|jgi:large subunit ribosomal protein L24